MDILPLILKVTYLIDLNIFAHILRVTYIIDLDKFTCILKVTFIHLDKFRGILKVTNKKKHYVKVRYIDVERFKIST